MYYRQGSAHMNIILYLALFFAGGGVRRRWRHPHLSVRRTDLRLVRQEHRTENVRTARGSR